MRVTKFRNRGEHGVVVEPLIFILAVAVFLNGFLYVQAKAHAHGQSMLASVITGVLGGLVGLAIVAGLLWSVMELSIRYEDRKRRRQPEKKRRIE